MSVGSVEVRYRMEGEAMKLPKTDGFAALGKDSTPVPLSPELEVKPRFSTLIVGEIWTEGGTLPIKVSVAMLGTSSSKEVVVRVSTVLYVLLEAGARNVVVYVPTVEYPAISTIVWTVVVRSRVVVASWVDRSVCVLV